MRHPHRFSALPTAKVARQTSGLCTDKAENATSLTKTGINIDKTPPVIAGMPASNCSLWPSNHNLVQVATVSSTDGLSTLASFTVTGTSNEPMDPNDPDIVIDGSGIQPRTIQLRADRLGNGTGRIYTLTATAADKAGNSTTSTATCVVPHDQGQ